MAVVEVLFGDGYNDGLPRGDEEGPLAAHVLHQDGGEALHRAKDGAMDDYRALEACLKGVLLPQEVLLVEFILGEKFGLQP